MKPQYIKITEKLPYQASRKGGLTKTQRKLFKTLHQLLIENVQEFPRADRLNLLTETRDVLEAVGIYTSDFWIDGEQNAFITYQPRIGKKYYAKLELPPARKNNQ